VRILDGIQDYADSISPAIIVNSIQHRTIWNLPKEIKKGYKNEVVGQNFKPWVSSPFRRLARGQHAQTGSAADTVTDTLVKAGFAASDVSLLLPENLGTRQIGTEKATKAPESATAGAGTGAVLGGTLGFPGLASLTLGTLRFLRKVHTNRVLMRRM
jgi:hypothetical protein